MDESECMWETYANDRIGMTDVRNERERVGGKEPPDYILIYLYHFVYVNDSREGVSNFGILLYYRQQDSIESLRVWRRMRSALAWLFSSLGSQI